MVRGQGEMDEAIGEHGQAVIRVDLSECTGVRISPADGRVGLPTVRSMLQDDVDDTRDGVGAVLRRRAVAQNLDVVDRGNRYQIQVHRRRPGADGGEIVDERRAVATLAIDQDQDIVAGETTNCVGRYAGGCAAAVLRRQREGWDCSRQNLLQSRLAGGADLLAADDVDRHRAVAHRAWLAAAQPGDHEFVESAVARRRLGRCGVGGSGRRRGSASGAGRSVRIRRRAGEAGGPGEKADHAHRHTPPPVPEYDGPAGNDATRRTALRKARFAETLSLHVRIPSALVAASNLTTTATAMKGFVLLCLCEIGLPGAVGRGARRFFRHFAHTITIAHNAMRKCIHA